MVQVGFAPFGKHNYYKPFTTHIVHLRGTDTFTKFTYRLLCQGLFFSLPAKTVRLHGATCIGATRHSIFVVLVVVVSRVFFYCAHSQAERTINGYFHFSHYCVPECYTCDSGERLKHFRSDETTFFELLFLSRLSGRAKQMSVWRMAPIVRDPPILYAQLNSQNDRHNSHSPKL